MSEGGFPVLLVEDDPNDVLLMRRAFRKAMLSGAIRVVRDGEEAVSYLAGEGDYADRGANPLPLLLLLDLKLPRKSGFEVLSWLRGQPTLRRLPVAILTSSRQMEDVNRAYDIGANSYLVKPVAFDDLLSLVKAIGLYWMEQNVQPDVVDR